MAILNDGFNTTINFPFAGTLFIEKEITPPSLDGGGEINITAMRNFFWRTRAPKFLRTLDKIALKVRFDPKIYFIAAMPSQLNVNQIIGLIFPVLTNSPPRTLSFPGWANKFSPGSFKEGEEPLADMEIIPSMQVNGIETSITAT